MYFAAIELKKDENPQEAVRVFLYATADNGALYSKLQVYSLIEVGRTKFVRFCSDCSNYSQPVLKRLQQESRAIIAPSKNGYLVFMSDGRVGPFSTSQMQGVIAPGYGQIYQGPRKETWEGQFV